MVGDIDQEMVGKIRKLYEKNPVARRFFDWVADLERDATETTLDRIRRKIEINRREAVDLARQLDDVGCANFIVGRHGQKSRLRWLFSRVSLGKVATGEATDLEESHNPINEADDEPGLPGDAQPESTTQKLTIAEAKAALALSLGVPITNIEIIVKG